MATRRQAIAVIGPAVDAPLSTAGYVTRYLRDNGLGPKDGPGGKSSAHLERADLASIPTALLSTTVLTDIDGAIVELLAHLLLDTRRIVGSPGTTTPAFAEAGEVLASPGGGNAGNPDVQSGKDVHRDYGGCVGGEQSPTDPPTAIGSSPSTSFGKDEPHGHQGPPREIHRGFQ
jgi:hypothetical protein